MQKIKETLAQKFFGSGSEASIKPFDGYRDTTVDIMLGLMRNGYVQDLDQQYDYGVYRFRPNLVHVSLAFRTDWNRPGQYFIVGLTGIQDDTTSGAIVPEVKGVDKDKDKFHVDYAATVNCTARYVITLALNLLDDFGAYNVLSNNCQDFANAMLLALGRPEAYEVTDPDVFIPGNNKTIQSRVTHHTDLARRAVEKTRQQEQERRVETAIGFERISFQMEEEQAAREGRGPAPPPGPNPCTDLPPTPPVDWLDRLGIKALIAKGDKKSGKHHEKHKH